MSSVRDEIYALRDKMDQYILGQSKIVEQILISILSNGHILVEGLPGLAKTTAIKALSENMECDFGRIQFTPDLVGKDITGKEIAYKVEEETHYKFEPGPIFHNIVLADEINRAPSKTQNSLLEAMEERQVTVAGIGHKVPDLFMVMATQNPGIQKGTFPLPEAQMDRFLMLVEVLYPTEETEVDIMRMIRDKSSQKQRKKEKSGKSDKDRVLTPQKTIFDARAEIDEVVVPPYIERYIVDLVFSTRYPERYTYELKSYISVGVSPRGTLSMDRGCRTLAWLRGRKEVIIEDVQEMIYPILRHRIGMTERAAKHHVHADELIKDMLDLVPVPDPSDAKAEDSGKIDAEEQALEQVKKQERIAAEQAEAEQAAKEAQAAESAQNEDDEPSSEQAAE